VNPGISALVKKGRELLPAKSTVPSTNSPHVAMAARCSCGYP